jgi:1-acyl-sn-glycerol-3-phosphate acyltransferase
MEQETQLPRWYFFIVLLRIFVVALLTLLWSVPVLLFSFFDPHAERSAQFIRLWARCVLWTCGITLRVQGREQLDPQRAYLFMANHQSNMDIPILMAAFEQLQVRWVSKQEVRKVPVIGVCMVRTHQVLVDRESPTQAIAVIRHVRALLAAGISVIFFPEGTRTRDGQLQPFKPGGFVVALESGVPVVPITINGSRAIWPPGGFDLRPGTVEVDFSEPIMVDPRLTKRAARELLSVKVREAMVARLDGTPVPTPSVSVSPVAVSTSASEHPSS